MRSWKTLSKETIMMGPRTENECRPDGQDLQKKWGNPGLKVFPLKRWDCADSSRSYSYSQDAPSQPR